MAGLEWKCKKEIIDTHYDAKLIMLFHWSLRTCFHRCYESSVRLTCGLGSKGRTCEYSTVWSLSREVCDGPRIKVISSLFLIICSYNHETDIALATKKSPASSIFSIFRNRWNLMDSRVDVFQVVNQANTTTRIQFVGSYQENIFYYWWKIQQVVVKMIMPARRW